MLISLRCLAGLVVFSLALGGLAHGQDKPSPPPQNKDPDLKLPQPSVRVEHPLYSSLRDVINQGVTLFNDKGDHAGCYRLFQGALIAIRPFLANDPDLAKHVDESLKNAEKLPRVVDRAYALRNVLNSVRDYYRPPGAKPSGPLPGTGPGTEPGKKPPTEIIPVPKKGEKAPGSTSTPGTAEEEKEAAKDEGREVAHPRLSDLARSDIKSSDAAEMELKRLEGKWQQVQVFGPELQTLIKGGKWISTFKENQIVDLAFWIDPTKDPKEIDFTTANKEVMKAIYELKGDTLRIAKPDTTQALDERPKSIDSAVNVERWERIKEKSESSRSDGKKDDNKTADLAKEVLKSETVVAYVYGNIPITRQDFGEYLIARMGPERIDALVNRRIIELACRKQGIFVSDVEVETQFADDLKVLGDANVTTKEFADTILKRFNRNLYEWKEDIIRPRLAMAKLVKASIKIQEADILKAFAAKYGPRVECRMIVMGSKAEWDRIHSEVAASEEAFARVAQSKTQVVEFIRDRAGKVPPIHKNFGDEKIEKAAFALKVGEVSEPIAVPDGTAVIIKCDRHIAGDENVKLEQVRASLEREVMEKKVTEKLPEVLRELRQEAAPVILIGKR